MKGGGRGEPPGCPGLCTGLASKGAKLWQKNLQGRLVQKLRCQGSTGAVPGVVPAPRRASGEHPGLVSTAGGALRGNEPVGAPLCCSSALTPPGFHAALCAAKPPSAFQANMIFQALFAPTRAQCLPPINTCPTWLLGCLFSLHEQRTKK